MTRVERALAVGQALVYLTSASTIVVFRETWHRTHAVVDSRMVETHVGWLTAVAAVLLYGAWRGDKGAVRPLAIASAAALVVVNVHDLVTGDPAPIFLGDLALQAAFLAAWVATLARAR